MIGLRWMWRILLLLTGGPHRFLGKNDAWMMVDALAEIITAGHNHHNKLVILGLGRVGMECAKVASDSFTTIVGTVRSETGRNEEDGILRVSLNEVGEHLRDASHILWTIPLPKDCDEGLEQILAQLESEASDEESCARWIGMISTTGVYGNHDGAWVTEESPLFCTPSSNARLYVEVEQRFMNMGGCIFRSSGIYDSTRSALHTVFKSGKRPTAQPEETETITNRIHAHDIARAVNASMTKGTKNRKMGRIYNLADDQPAPRYEVLEHAATLLESIGASFTDDSSGSKTINQKSATKRERRRLSDRKLVSNERMKAELIDHLVYPTYKEGLEAILKHPTAPWYTQPK